MDATHLHLMLNHFPIIGSLIGFLLLMYGFIRRNDEIKLAATILILCMALTAIVVFQSGEPAEEKVENIATVSEQAIEAHEEAAELAFWTMEAGGLLALIILVLHLTKNAFRNRLYLVLAILTAISFGLMARTGWLGGKIRHTELSASAAGNGENQILSEPNKSETEEDED